MKNATKSEPQVIYSHATTQFGFGCCIFLIFLGFIGNASTVAALVRSPTLRKRMTSVFIISLSVTDLIFCVINLPLTATRFYHRSWVMGETWCKLFPFIFYLNVAASLYHIMSISINRCILIAFYSTYRRVYNPLSVALNILFCWGLPFTLLVPTLFGEWGRFGYSPHTFSCTILSVEGVSPKKALLCIGVLPPTIATIFCYLGIYFKFRQSRNAVTSMKTQKVDIALTRVVLAIFCAFFICYGPLLLVNIVDKNEEKAPWLHVVASVLAWSSAAVNPVVYAIMNSQYRKAYWHLLPKALKGWVSELSRTRSSDLSTMSARSTKIPPVLFKSKEQRVAVDC